MYAKKEHNAPVSRVIAKPERKKAPNKDRTNLDVIERLSAQNESKILFNPLMPVQKTSFEHEFTQHKGVAKINIDDYKSDSSVGLKGVITYTPTSDAHDADPIRLIQVVNAMDPTTDKAFEWSGKEARREKTKTENGWFLDHRAAYLKPRTKTDDEKVPDAYIDAFGVQDAPDCNHGKKKGKDIVSASMQDCPSSASPYKFRAEVQIRGKETDEDTIYGHITWGFETENSDGLLHVKKRYIPTFQENASVDFNAAYKKFHDVYRNPESDYSPEKIEELARQDFAEAMKRLQQINDWED